MYYGDKMKTPIQLVRSRSSFFYNERWLKRFREEPFTENVLDNASTFKTFDDLNQTTNRMLEGHT
jgi:hypothetical protein